MENSILSSAECPGRKDHNPNVNVSVGYYLLAGNNMMDSVCHGLILDQPNHKTSVVVVECLLLRGIFCQKSWWRVGRPHIHLGRPTCFGPQSDFLVHRAPCPHGAFKFQRKNQENLWQLRWPT